MHRRLSEGIRVYWISCSGSIGATKEEHRVHWQSNWPADAAAISVDYDVERQYGVATMTLSLPSAIVVDVETTGFGKHDRVVEIAAVTLASGTWEIEDEFDTLINPERDVGPVGVHGISASMVELAPVFGDVIGSVARRMHGRVLVAHNLPFDRRMLCGEFYRHGVDLLPGEGLCTLRATRKKLPQACKDLGIVLDQQHRALADARATAELAKRIWHDNRMPSAVAAHVGETSAPSDLHTIRRGLTDKGISEMHRIVSLAHYPNYDERICCYLDALDWILDDAVINSQERRSLEHLAKDLGISHEEQQQAHQTYLDSILKAALRDGVVTKAESKLVTKIAKQLGLPHAKILPVPEQPIVATVRSGMRICFTGTAMVDGAHIDRDALVQLAQARGLVPVNRVTKQGCDMLVAADPSSASRKAKAARKYGIPVMSIKQFFDNHG